MKAITVPAQIRSAMERGAAMVVSISGGKDSQVLARAMAALHAQEGWTGPLVAIHADLGRIEWDQTPQHVAQIAAEMGAPLAIVRRRNGQGKWDMVDRWEERAQTMADAGKAPRPWSDAGNRFCTAEMKRDPINTFLRRYPLVVSVEGIRAEESPARAKKPVWSRRERICTQQREAYTWNPLLDWTLAADIWPALGTTVQDLAIRRMLHRDGRVAEALDGWQAHPVYVLGNERLSCAFCVLGCKGDLRNAARHMPALHLELVEMEQRWGFAFKKGAPLADLLPQAVR